MDHQNCQNISYDHVVYISIQPKRMPSCLSAPLVASPVTRHPATSGRDPSLAKTPGDGYTWFAKKNYYTILYTPLLVVLLFALSCL